VRKQKYSKFNRMLSPLPWIKGVDALAAEV
jgi:hypothetical protein